MRCSGRRRTPRPTNATASPPTAQRRWWSRCPRPRRRCRRCSRTCHRLGVPVVARGAGTGLSGGAMPHTLGVTLSLAKFNQILEIDPVARTAVRAVRRAQPRDQRGGGALRPLLRARPVEPDRLHHRRQRGRELGRRALPEVRPDAAQRAARARLHGRGRAGRVRQRGARLRPGSTCSRSSSAAKACWPSPPRSPSSWCPSRSSRAASWPASTTCARPATRWPR